MSPSYKTRSHKLNSGPGTPSTFSPRAELSLHQLAWLLVDQALPGPILIDSPDQVCSFPRTHTYKNDQIVFSFSSSQHSLRAMDTPCCGIWDGRGCPQPVFACCVTLGKFLFSLISALLCEAAQGIRVRDVSAYEVSKAIWSGVCEPGVSHTRPWSFLFSPLSSKKMLGRKLRGSLMALPPYPESRPPPVSHRDSLEQLCLAGGNAATISRGGGWFPHRKGLGLSFQKFAGIPVN